MKRRKFAVLVLGLALGVLVAVAGAGSSQDQNVPWELEFQGKAGRAGVCIIRITVDSDIVNAMFRVDQGMDAVMKAAAGADAVRQATPLLAVEYTKGDNEFFARPVDPNQAISGATIICPAGETGDGWKDDPPPQEFLLTGRFGLEGVGKDPDGIARVQLGGFDTDTGPALPIVEVSTFGKTAEQVIDELAAEFNSLYADLGFEAVTVPGGLDVPCVPCPLGMRGGTTDSGMSFTIGLMK